MSSSPAATVSPSRAWTWTIVPAQGVPTVTVPMGTMADIGMPVGLTFAGRAWDDFKDTVRRGWEEVRDALDMEDRVRLRLLEDHIGVWPEQHAQGIMSGNGQEDARDD